MLHVVITERLVLTPFRATDIDRLHALWTEPEVRRYLWDDLIISRDRAAEEVERGLANAKLHGIGYWNIESRNCGALCGFCGFRPINDGPDIELMYGLRRCYWGMGIATEASRALLAWLWNSTSYARVFARTDPPNKKSLAVMERLGMRLYSSTLELISYMQECDCQSHCSVRADVEAVRKETGVTGEN